VEHAKYIRSFVRREGRLTAGQQRALDRLLPIYGIDFSTTPLDLNVVFGRQAPRTLEIGFGNGETLLALATQHPERDYLGIEVYCPGIGRLLRGIEERGLGNIRVSTRDAMGVLEHQLPPCSLHEVLLFFPDPWPKKRHHKRRLVQAPFVELVVSRLVEGGRFHLATDWQDYAEHMLDVLQASPWFDSTAAGNSFSPDRGERPQTKFEQRGLKLGHNVWDLIYRRNAWEPTCQHQ
jgi:tRNA (guanine-N7-)-methyltransferase